MSGGYNYNWIQWWTVDRFQVELDVKVKLILYSLVLGQIFHLIVVITDKCVSSQLNWFPFPHFSLSDLFVRPRSGSFAVVKQE